MRIHLGLGLLAVLPMLAGCVQQSEQQQRAEAACRAQANVVEARINRPQMAERDQSTTPFSANGVPGIHTESAINQDTYDQLVSDCLNGTGTLPAQ